MVENKTKATGADVLKFLHLVEPQKRRDDALVLHDLFTKLSGFEAHMWGPSIIGFGQYHYVYDSGREGDFLATGFSPRKANMVLYIMPGYQDYDEILGRLGKHRLGKSCLYINKLDDIDLDVLRELIKAGLRDLNKIWPVKPG